jgi:hypothetical protein
MKTSLPRLTRRSSSRSAFEGGCRHRLKFVALGGGASDPILWVVPGGRILATAIESVTQLFGGRLLNPIGSPTQLVAQMSEHRRFDRAVDFGRILHCGAWNPAAAACVPYWESS